MTIWSKKLYLLIRPLDRALTFIEAVFYKVAMEWLFGDEDVWFVELDHLVQKAIPLIRPLDRAQTFTDVVFLMVAVEWLISDEDVLSVELEYRLKRAIPFDPTVVSPSNFYAGCFP